MTQLKVWFEAEFCCATEDGRIRGCQYEERSKILLHLVELIEKHNDQIAMFETWDTGKPYKQVVKIGVHWLNISIIMLAGQIKFMMSIHAEGTYCIQTLHELIEFVG
ncbi:hypothetical protein AABB24_034034 [Solanum stoloniferum]|uniref:Aldehyde dehydrogenase domain-containing protein n=1 Tax=Solanum stoloniferum TaxID=62892 RepID=A0ABD2RDV7_9SOLN